MLVPLEKVRLGCEWKEESEKKGLRRIRKKGYLWHSTVGSKGILNYGSL